MKFHPTIVRTTASTPLGQIQLAATSSGLAGMWFEGQRHLPPQLGEEPRWREDASHPILLQAAEQLRAYFGGARADFDIPLDLQGGTPFQQTVWQALLSIPRGSTISYGGLSARLGRPTATRAVGAAIGRNPVSIIVPCHRVIGVAGALTGYAGGVDRKTALLRLEGAL